MMTSCSKYQIYSNKVDFSATGCKELQYHSASFDIGNEPLMVPLNVVILLAQWRLSTCREPVSLWCQCSQKKNLHHLRGEMIFHVSPLTAAISCAKTISKIGLVSQSHPSNSYTRVSPRLRSRWCHGAAWLRMLGKGHSFIFLEASQASSVIIPVIHQTLQVQVGMVASSALAVPISEYLFLSAAFLASSALVGALPSPTPRRTWSAQISKIWKCVPMQWKSYRGINGGREIFLSVPGALLTASTQQKSSLNQINLCDTTGAQDASIFKIW